MKLTWQSTHDGRLGFHSELDEYDAFPPVESLLLDHAPHQVNLEREAIAAYLAFGHWVSGDLRLPHKLGPNTASAIERDLKHVDVRPSPIEYYPKPLETGLRTVSVDFDGSEISSALPSLSILPASTWTGALRSHQSLAVGSNAFALDAAASERSVSVRSRLAVAVLFAGDLSADALSIDLSRIHNSEIQRLRDLLGSVNLGLSAPVFSRAIHEHSAT